MEFADAGGAVAGFAEQHRQALDAVEGLKVMVVVLEAIHAVAVIVLAGEDDGARRTAARGRAEGVCKARAIGGERVEVRGLDHRVAVAAEGVEAVVVGDDHHDVRTWGGGEAGRGECSS